jgi:hypothetical protein
MPSLIGSQDSDADTLGQDPEIDVFRWKGDLFLN